MEYRSRVATVTTLPDLPVLLFNCLLNWFSGRQFVGSRDEFSRLQRCPGGLCN